MQPVDAISINRTIPNNHNSLKPPNLMTSNQFRTDDISISEYQPQSQILRSIQIISMQRFQNVKLISSPPTQNSPFEQNPSTVISRRPFEPTRLFYQSGVRNESRPSFSDISLAKSGFININPLQESTIRGVGRGIGNLSEDRIRKIAKDFVNFYGNDTEIPSNGLYRIQRQAYERSSQKPQFGEQSIKQLLKTMDQNRDGRVTEDDIISLCRRYLSCEKRPIAFTPMVQERLAVARRLFKQFDVQKKGVLTEKQVPNLLAETYRSLGKTFAATEEDIKSWMKLADGDGDGQVTLQEYERSIIRALKKQGIKIYQQ